MADPFTWMAIAGAGATIAGGGITAFGQSSAGADAQKMYQYRAGVAKMNAAIQRSNSDYALDVGGREAERSGLSTRFTLAREKVAQSGGGFDVNTGSNADLRDSTQAIGKIDQDTINTNYGRQAQGFRNQALGLDAEAAGDIMAGDNAKKAGNIAALGTLIGTAGSVASKWGAASQSFGAPSSGITTYGPDFLPTGYIKTA